MEGFAQGRCVLARNITRAWPDLTPYDTIRFVGTDGRIAYEGRSLRFPANNLDGHRITAELVGWATHANDRSFNAVYVDSDITRWGPATDAYQTALQAAGYNHKGPGTVLGAALSQSFDGAWPVGELPVCDAWYDAGPGCGIGHVYYSSTPGVNVSEADANWFWTVLIVDDTAGAGAVGPGDLQGAPANSGVYDVADAGKRFAHAQLLYGAAGGGAGVQYTLDWRLVVYGDQRLPRVGATEPPGLLTSDIFRDIGARYAPMLDMAGVRDTTQPTHQAAWRDRTEPFTAWLELNAAEGRQIAVWENRRVDWTPVDRDTVTWVARLDEGARVEFEGASTEGQANGVAVIYDDVDTGRREILDPGTHPELADANPSLAANRAGLLVWEDVPLTKPTTAANALRVGVTVLADLNRPRFPARVTIRGHIRDANENWHPGDKVRSGETMIIADYDSAPPRLVHETTWDRDTATLTVNLDADADTIDAQVARIGG